MATKQEIVLELRREMLSTRGTLYKVFEGHLMRSIFSQIHQSYLDRSLGRADRYGNKWKPLAPYTIAKKRSKGFHQTATRRMIETRQGIRSYQPGRATRRGYVPVNSDQVFSRQHATIRFGSRIRHLRFAEQKGPGRPVLTPRMMKIIMERAIRVALGKMTQEIKRRYK